LLPHAPARAQSDAAIAPIAAKRIVIAAAASTLAPLDEAIRQFRTAGALAAPPSPQIVPLYGSSGALARQIIQGGPAQVFISADGRWMDAVAKAGYVAPDTRRVFVANALVLAAPSDSRLRVTLEPGVDLAKAIGDGRLATADPAHAPLGRYAQSALERLGAWKGVEARLLRLADAAQARVIVERGAAAAGILYASDVAGNSRLRTVAAFPPGTYPPPVYEIAVVGLPEPAADQRAARAFADWLTGAAAQAIFKRHGFLTAAEAR
jgi:molybdate transport system substrate-binding protein